MPATSLTPVAIEELDTLVRRAFAVACLINSDTNVGAIASDAAGAMSACLLDAQKILAGADHG